MKITYKTKDYRTITEDVRIIRIYDADGNEYRINLDKEHGLEILVESGKAVIEPRVSNHLTLYTKE